MNGRIHDPALGRFLQADPYVQSGSDLQGLNRCAYVLNSPLNAVDPSGYEANPIVQWIIQRAVECLIQFAIDTTRSELFGSGGNAGFAGALRNGLIAGTTPWGFTSATGASHPSSPLGGTLNRGVAMNLTNCMGGVLANGRYGHWFPSAGTGGFLGGPLGSWIGFTLGERSKWIMQAVPTFRTVTPQSGGKFANGAPGGTSADAQAPTASAVEHYKYPCAMDGQVTTCNTADWDGADKKHSPLAPPGVDIYENMREAELPRGLLYGPNWFHDQVTDWGPWDYKRRHPDFEDFGNFHYGAVGSATGWFFDYTLLDEAGRNQLSKGNSKPEWGKPSPVRGLPFGTGSYGDDPRDQASIRAGIDFRRNPENWHQLNVRDASR